MDNLNASDLQPGTRVDITIRLAEVHGHGGPGWVIFDLDHGPRLTLPVDHPSVTVDPVASHWPPRPGQVWRTPDGREFFIRKHLCTHEPGTCFAEVELVSADGEEPPYPLETTVPAAFRPLTLVYPRPEDGAR